MKMILIQSAKHLLANTTLNTRRNLQVIMKQDPLRQTPAMKIRSASVVPGSLHAGKNSVAPQALIRQHKRSKVHHLLSVRRRASVHEQGTE